MKGKHVFVSHAGADKPRIRPIVEALLTQGFEVWIDEPRRFKPRLRHASLKRIRSCEHWAASILSNIANAGCVLVVWSRAALASEVVEDEARLARKRGVLVSVAIDDVEPPLGFGRTHVTPLTEELAAYHAGQSAVLDLDDIFEDIRELVADDAHAGEIRHDTSAGAGAIAIPVAAFAGGSAIGDASSPGLRHDSPVPYMLDRYEQTRIFIKTIAGELARREAPRRPCVFLLPSPAEELPEMLVEVFRHKMSTDIPREIGGNVDWEPHRFDWPNCGNGLKEGKASESRYLSDCLACLGDRLAMAGVNRLSDDPAAFAHAFKTRLLERAQSAFLFWTRINPGDGWSPRDERLILAFLSWWNTLASTADGPLPILVISLIGAREPAVSGWRWWPGSSGRTNVYRFVQKLEESAYPSLRLVRLDPLEPVTQHHIENWLIGILPEHMTLPDAHASRVRRALPQLFGQAGKRPLEEVGQCLADLLGAPATVRRR